MPRHHTPTHFVEILVFIALLAGVAPGLATAGERVKTGRPIVLVIGVADSVDGKERERRFVTNLALNIDGFSVQRVTPPIKGFAKSSLDRQITYLKPLMKDSDAVAAMWLSAVSRDVLLLQVVVLDTGRALVRLFEGELKEGAEEKLALTASELLGTAYMFDPPSREIAPEIHELVVSTREQAGVAVSEDNPWRLYLTGLGKAGAIGGEGPRTRVGGVLGAERRFLDWFAVRFGVGSTYGPFGPVQELTLRGYDVWAELGVVWRLTINRVHFGPLLKVYAGPSTVVVKGEGLGRTDYNNWNIYGALGVEFAISLMDPLSMTMAVGLEATPRQMEVQRRSDGGVIYANAFMGIWGAVGLMFL